MNRAVTVNLHDTTVGVWQDDARDPTFRAEIYRGLLRLLRRRRWVLGPDPKVAQWPSLRHDNRLGQRGDLRLAVSISGRCVELLFWAETWPISNRNGRRYDFHKREKLNYLDRLRVDLETRKIVAWLERRAAVTVDRRDVGVGARMGQLTAEAFIRRQYAASWHSDKDLGRPVCRNERNSKSADGGHVEHGATVWFAARDGRILRGVAHYHINNMWYVVTDRYSVRNIASFEIFTRPPADIRTKRNARLRRERLEGELKAAIRRCDFRRAERLKRIAFGEAQTYAIWSRKWEAYYRPSGSGYTADALSAGRYTWEEAVAEVRRVPHILSLALPDGRLVEAAELDTVEPLARAA